MARISNVSHRRITGWPINIFKDILSILDLPHESYVGQAPNDLEDTLFDIMQCLSERGLKVIELLYIQSLSTYDAAIILQISVPSVSRNCAAAVNTLSMQWLKLHMGTACYTVYKEEIEVTCSASFANLCWGTEKVEMLQIPVQDAFCLNRHIVYRLSDIKRIAVKDIMRLPIETETQKKVLLVKSEIHWKVRSKRMTHVKTPSLPGWPENLMQELFGSKSYRQNLRFVEDRIAWVLSEDEVKVIILYFKEKNTLADIANITYVTYEAARRRKAIALQKLRKVPWLFEESPVKDAADLHIIQRDNICVDTLQSLVLREETIKWLNTAGIKTVSELEACTTSYLKKLPRCSRKRIAEIQLALQLIGTSLYD